MRRFGHSLVEILCALALFAVLLLPLWTSLIQSNEIIQVGYHELEVQSIGTTFISQVKHIAAENFVQILTPLPYPDDKGIVKLPPKGIAIEMPKWNKDVFSITFSVTGFCQSQYNRLARWVEIEVKWKDQVGEAKSACFPVVLFKRKLN